MNQDEPEAKEIALAIELFTHGSLNTFAKKTNVDTNSRLICYDILDLERMHNDTNAARFHTEFDNERVYTQNELAQMFASVEWQADTMGASLLMPKFIVENALAKFANSKPIKIYGDTTFAKRDKEIIRKMAAYLGVSYTALVIRLRGLDMLEYHDISEYISNELQLGGVQ